MYTPLSSHKTSLLKIGEKNWWHNGPHMGCLLFLPTLSALFFPSVFYFTCRTAVNITAMTQMAKPKHFYKKLLQRQKLVCISYWQRLSTQWYAYRKMCLFVLLFQFCFIYHSLGFCLCPCPNFSPWSPLGENQNITAKQPWTKMHSLLSCGSGGFGCGLTFCAFVTFHTGYCILACIVLDWYIP